MGMPNGESWYENTELGKTCTDYSHCEHCEPNGNCDLCGTVDGRWMEAVNCYASTCDGCAELTMNDQMTMDEETQLGYCETCAKELGFDVMSYKLKPRQKEQP